MSSNVTLEQLEAQQQLISHFQIAQPLVLAMLALSFPLELAGFVEFLLDKKKRRERHNFYLRLSLFASCVFILAAAAVSMIMAFGAHFDHAGCNVLVRVTSGVYVVAVLSSLSFLLQKSRLTGKFEVGAPTYQFIFKAVNLGLICMIPAGLGMALIVSEPKLVLDGRCLMAMPTWYPWFFCVATASLSTALVWLFIHPIHSSLTNFNGSEAKALRRVYYKNAVISSSAVLITFSIFIAFAICHHLASSDGDDSMLIVALMLLNFDLIVMSAAGRLTTTIWLPTYVKERLLNKTSTSSTPGGASGGGSKYTLNSPAYSSKDNSKHAMHTAGGGGGAHSSNVSPVVPFANLPAPASPSSSSPQ